ncbi:hypothetical protein IPA_05700 [Ignicoccus pacificus DSM 13166]|uniref:Uncharacterized protein n=1 Tax=Ignicoccus pacificus DSM 13166 TaxID=940294 RepID=A0A977K9R1_9CREN|nr:hypothetical protein IPA_05700 [Ignicoccus pacificus DSM 13166]
MTSWYLKCERCGQMWLFLGSYDLESIGRIYHYCRVCGRNTFHTVVKKAEL